MARAPVLVWRNVTRVRLINAFRVAYEAPPDVLLPGEPLVCDGIELPLKHRKRRMDLEARGLIKGAQAIYLGPGARPGFARLFVVGAEDPRVGVASIIQIEAPDQEEPMIVSAASMGAVFLHGAAVTIHKAQGSQWPEVQVFAPDLYAASRSGRQEAGRGAVEAAGLRGGDPGGGAAGLGHALCAGPAEAAARDRRPGARARRR